MFPVTHVDRALDAAVPPHEFRNHEDEAVYKMCESSGLLSPTPQFSSAVISTIATRIPCAVGVAGQTPGDVDTFR